ncbi:MAG: glycerol-3-phosphate 1-O-acyltransferase PlsY [Leptolyngbyaceae cyanobacterium bins.59]|nr:glycerol-3-phosphate 1-O-acyltransferase PlsY [Leptolyngbyaceae cyanobacterium bins.59]
MGNGIWWVANVGVLVVAYLLGSLPSGYLAGKLLKGIDIREQGSGSTGATNVLRTVGKGPAAVVLAADILKGVAAVLFVRWLGNLPTLIALAPSAESLTIWIPWLATLAGLAALLGHSRSIWLKFTGGKSVATGLGVLLTLDWQVGLATLGVFVILLALFRIVSLGSIAAAFAVGILMVALQKPLAYQLFAVTAGAYVILRHRGNIQRLLAGTEPQIGQKLPQSEEAQS